MNNNHIVTFRPTSSKVRSVLAVLVLLALVGSTFSQSQPARISKRIESILSGRAIERAPARAPESKNSSHVVNYAAKNTKWSYRNHRSARLARCREFNPNAAKATGKCECDAPNACSSRYRKFF